MADKSKVTRIKANDSAAATPAKEAKTAKSSKATPAKATKAVKANAVTATPVEAKKNVFARIGGYFKGAWVELKQVRWPTRRATWGLTLAVLLFSAFFVVLILLLDTFFQYIFKLIIV